MVKNQYALSIKEVQVDAGGEFQSQKLTLFLQKLGMNILTSIPHIHQQNGCTERFICTVIDKAQAMCLDACLPQNWWEFAVDCARHVYNCTPIKHHDWKMSFENLKHTKLDVTRLCVFGCGKSVFLPEEVYVNKFNLKSKLMTFLGYPQGTKGYLFMRGPNNTLFTVTKALFDETLFLRCPDMCCPRYTPVASPVDAQGDYNIPPDDNENGDHGGVDLHSAPPRSFVPYQAPLPGDNQNPGPPILPGSTPPPLRCPQGDPDSFHGFFNPNPDCNLSYDQKEFEYGDLDDPSIPTRVLTIWEEEGSESLTGKTHHFSALTLRADI